MPLLPFAIVEVSMAKDTFKLLSVLKAAGVGRQSMFKSSSVLGIVLINHNDHS